MLQINLNCIIFTQIKYEKVSILSVQTVFILDYLKTGVNQTRTYNCIDFGNQFVINQLFRY